MDPFSDAPRTPDWFAQGEAADGRDALAEDPFGEEAFTHVSTVDDEEWPDAAATTAAVAMSVVTPLPIRLPDSDQYIAQLEKKLARLHTRKEVQTKRHVPGERRTTDTAPWRKKKTYVLLC